MSAILLVETALTTALAGHGVTVVVDEPDGDKRYWLHGQPICGQRAVGLATINPALDQLIEAHRLLHLQFKLAHQPPPAPPDPLPQRMERRPTPIRRHVDNRQPF